MYIHFFFTQSFFIFFLPLSPFLSHSCVIDIIVPFFSTQSLWLDGAWFIITGSSRRENQ